MIARNAFRCARFVHRISSTPLYTRLSPFRLNTKVVYNPAIQIQHFRFSTENVSPKEENDQKEEQKKERKRNRRMMFLTLKELFKHLPLFPIAGFILVFIFATKLSSDISKGVKDLKNVFEPEHKHVKPEDLTPTHIVFMDIQHGNKPLGRIHIGLYGDIVPDTVLNFLELTVAKDGYQGNIFHRVVKGFMIQGGDIVNRDGTGSKSIYGNTFPDENFDIPHFEGCVSMANIGKDTNGCQFYITTTNTPWLNNKFVVFGRIVGGEDVIRKMENVETDENDRPIEDLTIVKCGVLGLEELKEFMKGENAKLVMNPPEYEVEESKDPRRKANPKHPLLDKYEKMRK